MMEELYDTISAYLKRQLPENEREAFEQKMAADATLREEVEAHRLAAEAIEWSIADSLRKEMASWSESASGVSPAAPHQATVRPLWRRALAVAATVLIVVVAGAYLWSNQYYSNAALAGDYYPKGELAGLRSGSTEADALTPGYEALSKGHYTEAADLFGKLISDSLVGSKALYFKAHAHFQQQQFEQAIADLNKLAASSTGEEKDRAEWLLSLSYLGAGQTAEAQTRVAQIAANQDHSYYPQARRLSGDLSSLWRKIAQ